MFSISKLSIYVTDYMIANKIKNKEEVAKRIGIAKSSLNKIIAGDMNPTVDMLYKICIGLNITPNDCFDNKDWIQSNSDSKSGTMLNSPHANYITQSAPEASDIISLQKNIITLQEEKSKMQEEKLQLHERYFDLKIEYETLKNKYVSDTNANAG